MGIRVVRGEFVRDSKRRCSLADAGHPPQDNPAPTAPSHGVDAGPQLAFAINEISRRWPKLVLERPFLTYTVCGWQQPTHGQLAHAIGQPDPRHLTNNFAADLLEISIIRITEELQTMQVR